MTQKMLLAVVTLVCSSFIQQVAQADAIRIVLNTNFDPSIECDDLFGDPKTLCVGIKHAQKGGCFDLSGDEHDICLGFQGGLARDCSSYEWGEVLTICRGTKYALEDNCSEVSDNYLENGICRIIREDLRKPVKSTARSDDMDRRRRVYQKRRREGRLKSRMSNIGKRMRNHSQR